MKDNNHYFIKLPTPGGGWKYEEIDKDRLDSSSIQTLYTREKNSKAPGGRFVPLFGGTVPERKTTIETSGLLKIIDEIMEQWLFSLNNLDRSGETAAEIKKLDFASLASSLANRDFASAKKALQEILYGLMSLTIGQAAKIKDSSESVSRLSSTIEAVETIQDDFYIKWSGAAEEINFAVKKISSIETEVRSLLAEINSKNGFCRTLFGNTASDRGFLNGDTDNDGFLIVAFSYLKNPGSYAPDHVEKLLAKATGIIKKYASAKKQSEEIWERNFGGKKAELLEKQKEMENILFSFEKASLVMRECGNLLGEKTARPYDAGIALIDKDSFERAELMITSSQWSPSERKRKINELILSALALLEAPGIPNDMAETLAKTEAEIKKLAPLFENKEMQCERIEISTQSSSGDEALYEMALAIGGVTACQYYQMSVTTPQTIFDILCILGRCEYDNREFLEFLSEKIKADSEDISDQKKVHDRWKESGKTWVSFYPNGYRIKLSRKKLSLAKGLLEKHALDSGEIKLAAKKRKGKGYNVLAQILKPG